MRSSKLVKWLRENCSEYTHVTPSDLTRLNLDYVYKTGAVDVKRKKILTNLLQKYASFNGPLKSNSARRTTASTVMSFFKCNDSPLFGDFRVPRMNYEERRSRPIDVEPARQFISVLPIRAKTITTVSPARGSYSENAQPPHFPNSE